MVAPSQGVHIVVDRSFLPTDHAMLIPKTADGRVLFAVPWLGKTILGTTDTPRGMTWRGNRCLLKRKSTSSCASRPATSAAPRARLISSSIWVGLRPLVKPPDDDAGSTQALSREHTVLVSKSGLVTVTGGKWTTYRAMAEDVLDKCFAAALLPAALVATLQLKLVGAHNSWASKIS
jgi:glycerol-3-phosphate dehydrogenase